MFKRMIIFIFICQIQNAMGMFSFSEITAQAQRNGRTFFIEVRNNKQNFFTVSEFLAPHDPNGSFEAQQCIANYFGLGIDDLTIVAERTAHEEGMAGHYTIEVADHCFEKLTLLKDRLTWRNFCACMQNIPVGNEYKELMSDGKLVRSAFMSAQARAYCELEPNMYPTIYGMRDYDNEFCKMLVCAANNALVVRAQRVLKELILNAGLVRCKRGFLATPEFADEIIALSYFINTDWGQQELHNILPYAEQKRAVFAQAIEVLKNNECDRMSPKLAESCKIIYGALQEKLEQAPNGKPSWLSIGMRRFWQLPVGFAIGAAVAYIYTHLSTKKTDEKKPENQLYKK